MKAEDAPEGYGDIVSDKYDPASATMFTPGKFDPHDVLGWDEEDDLPEESDDPYVKQTRTWENAPEEVRDMMVKAGLGLPVPRYGL